MELVAQRPTLLHSALTSQPAPVKSETEQVATELDSAKAVTASSESTDNGSASEKSFKSDSRLATIERAVKTEEKRIVRGYEYNEEEKQLIYALKEEPAGDIIFEIPSETARRIRAFADEVIQLQENRSLGGEEKAKLAEQYEAQQSKAQQAEERAA